MHEKNLKPCDLHWQDQVKWIGTLCQPECNKWTLTFTSVIESNRAHHEEADEVCSVCMIIMHEFRLHGFDYIFEDCTCRMWMFVYEVAKLWYSEFIHVMFCSGKWMCLRFYGIDLIQQGSWTWWPAKCLQVKPRRNVEADIKAPFEFVIRFQWIAFKNAVWVPSKTVPLVDYLIWVDVNDGTSLL
jgi:hypothetical protein